ncbi:DUF3298 and DUF4163 domain-containing protein [Mucilaginibacter auburnensis]|nr:DUF3298 and DUF4163 domain-containing protein [Mucilaginibacter auburnensis]
MYRLRSGLFCLMILLGLNACQWGETNKTQPDVNTDTLAYTYKTIHQRANDCGDKADTNCTVAKLKYPEFKTDSALNDTIKSRLLNMFYTDKPYSGIDDMLKRYFDSYYNMKKTDERPDMVFDLDAYAKILRQDSSLTTLEVSGYSYQGGAHGGSVTTFINWNTKSNKSVTLSDILINNYQPELNKIAEKIFRSQEKLSDTSSLANDYFFANDKFALNNNYSITPLGLRFFYNQYEIKPYAAGTTELFVPYKNIRSLLRPNTVVTQYIK